MTKNYDIINNEKFVLMGRSTAPEYFAEGVTQIFFGFPITKILLHTVVEPQGEDTLEVRKATQYMSMPTLSMLQLANLILSSAKASEARLMNDLPDSVKPKVADILKNVKLAPPSSDVSFKKIPPVKETPAKRR